MAKTIKINNPFVGAIALILILGAVYFMTDRVLYSIGAAVLLGIMYYHAFWGKDKTPKTPPANQAYNPNQQVTQQPQQQTPNQVNQTQQANYPQQNNYNK